MVGLRRLGSPCEGGLAGMEPALLFLVLLPPPSAGALGLAGRHRAGARFTADRQEAAVMKWVVGNASVVQVGNHSVTCPIEQRVDLDKLILLIDRGAGDQCAVGRLIGAHTRDPCDGASKRTTERLDFAGPAARMPRFYRCAKAVRALARDQGFEALVMRIQGVDTTSVAAFGLTPKLIRLWKKPSGIERDHVDPDFLGEDRVRNRLILYPKARREDDSSADLTAHSRDALREIKPRKCVRDYEEFVPQNICVGQGCPPLQLMGGSMRRLASH